MTLRGIVAGHSGAPIAGARVFVIGWSNSTWMSLDPAESLMQKDPVERQRSVASCWTPVRTRADGSFEKPGLTPEGQYIVFVDARGYEPSTDFDVRPGDAPEFTLKPEARAVVQVVDKATGEPVDEARVVMMRRGSDGFSNPPDPTRAEVDTLLDVVTDTTMTPAPGEHLLGGIGTFRTEVLVMAPGRARALLVLPGAAPGEELRRSVQMIGESTVSGVVRDENGLPIEGVVVTAQPDSMQALDFFAERTRTDATGTYRLLELCADTWTLQFESLTHGPERVRVALGPEEHRTVDPPLLVLWGVVTGMVTYEDGTSGAGESVLCTTGRMMIEGGAQADGEGWYLLEGLRPGPWSIWAMKRRGYTTFSTLHDVVVGEGDRVQVDLVLPRRTEGDRVRVELMLPRRVR